jgi:hypothetical protein
MRQNSLSLKNCFQLSKQTRPPLKQLLERAEEVFSREKKSESGPDIKELHAKIGQLAMENDFLSVALGRIAEPSAKK